MVYVSDQADFISDEVIVFIGAEGSNTPHSLCVDGHLEQLIDPPTFTVEASGTPQLITEEMYT